MNTAEADLKKQQSLSEAEGRELWKSLDEKNSAPSTKLQRQEQEFYKLPKDQPKQSGSMDRRSFMKWFGAATALATGTACSRRPKDYLVPYVNKPQGFVYGKPVWYASSAPASGLGVLVKTREGRPIKLEGNPDHPLSEGALDVQTQAEVLNLYNPERLRGVRDLRIGKDIDSARADEQVIAALEKAKAGSVRLITGPVQSPSLRRAIRQFEDKYKAKTLSFSDLAMDPIARAHELVGGQARVPYLNFDQADFVLSIDADFLGSWLAPVEFAKQFSKRRKLHEGEENVARLVTFESAFTTTGVSSDSRFSIKPSHQFPLLMAIIGEVAGSMNLDSSIRQIVNKYDSKEVSKSLGLPENLIQKIAQELKAANGRSLVVAGGSGPQAVELQIAVILLNRLLGNYGSTVDLAREFNLNENSSGDFEEFLQEAQRGEVEVAVFYNFNPVYSRAGTAIENVLKEKVPTVVSVAPELHETARVSTFAFGESHFLESWGDSEKVTGVFSIQQPVIEPLHSTRAFGELLLSWTKSNQPWQDYVQQTWRENFYSSGDFTQWWRNRLREGVLTQSRSERSFEPKWSGGAALLASAEPDIKSKDLQLVTYQSIQLRDGRAANNAWLQELPDALSKVTWSNYAAVSPKLATQLKLKQNDVVLLKSSDSSLELPVFIQPGLSDGVVAVAAGYGRKWAGSIGSGRGDNAYKFVKALNSGSLQYSGQKLSLEKTSDRYELATTQQHFDLHGRDNDILQQTTLDKFLKDPKAAKKAEIDFGGSSYEPYIYAGHRWGMSIDLNKCTGCQACVVACYSENNVGIVGEEQVRMGRHMSWLRLDLYYKGSEDEPEATYEPMLCQHCERAPCETVCPVLATVHSSDGLNDMIYNRCVGTRYCANNCPYKVRRFNYFQYSDALAGEESQSYNDAESPLSLMINPDVTVRTRGVMEKCTFCVQRIRKTVDEFKYEAEGEYDYRIPDGSLKTACQQTCPSDAIFFGDLNDPNSKVSEMAEKVQGFKILDKINAGPVITYMPRVRNKGAEV